MNGSEDALLRGALHAALAASDPQGATDRHLPEPPAGRLIVIGGGKAAPAMAAAAEARFGAGVDLTGVLVTRYGQAGGTRRIELLEAAHPVPDEAGVIATRKILELVRSAGPDDLVLCLLSGGGSSLLCAPSGVDLAGKAFVTRELLAAGADIHALNTVRKHLSAVKGGWLAASSRAPMVTLAVSDVVGDDPGVIASGPTVPDPTTFADALEIVREYAPAAEAARRALEAGVAGERPETPKPGDPRLRGSSYRLVASGAGAVEAATEHLRRNGVHVLRSVADIVGDSTEVALRQAEEVRASIATLPEGAGGQPVAFVFGGETTVNRVGSQLVYGQDGQLHQPQGAGGPNGEWALALAASLAVDRPYWLLAADTDGIDGASTAAGAILGPTQIARLDQVQVADYLRRHDSHTLLERIGGLLTTGPTGTNVNALRVLLFPST